MQHKKKLRAVYGPTPYGFNQVDGELVEDEREQGIIRRIKRYRRSGWTFRRIASKLNESGIPTKNAKEWKPGTVHYLLNNDLYA